MSLTIYLLQKKTSTPMTLTEIKLTTNALNLLEDNVTPEIIQACLDKYPFH
jgi:hypothetical protein